MSNEIIETVEPTKTAAPVALRQSTTPAELLRMAVERGADMDMLERLMALQERHEANEARKSFVDAMAAFKREPLDIFKRKGVGYTTKDGDFVGYKHAELSDVVEVVVPALARNGFSHRWDVAQEQGRVIVTCIVTHRAGHSETLRMDAAPDDSGKKNKLQQVASTVTYLQRYTLLGITGTAARGVDDDGEGAGDGEDDMERLCAEAKAAQTTEELRKLARVGAKHFQDKRDRDGYAKYAAVVQERGAALKATEQEGAHA